MWINEMDKTDLQVEDGIVSPSNSQGHKFESVRQG